MNYDQMMASLGEWLSNNGVQLLTTLAVAVVLFIVSAALKKILLYRTERLEERHKVKRGVSSAVFVAFLFAAFFIWGPNLGNFGVFFGMVGAGLAFSLQEVLLSFAGGVIIIVRKPFDVGDRIEVLGMSGDVVDISLFHTSLLEVGGWVKADQSTGRLIIIPNGVFVRATIHNYTKGFPYIWNELPITVTYESDWRAAKEIILAQAQAESAKAIPEAEAKIKSMQKKYAVRYDHLAPIVYTEIADSGVKLTLRHLVEVRDRRGSSHRLSEAVLDEFLKHPRIDLAYPTTRAFRNTDEGKAELGGQGKQ